MKKAALGAVLAALAGLSQAQSSYWINEVYANPPGTDNGLEFFEIGTNGSIMLPGISLVVIEGDGAAAGTVDGIYEMTGFGTGSNGLLLWRDAATPMSYYDANGNVQSGPEAATTVRSVDFNPDIENGSNTFLLVFGFNGSVGTDYDANNDGSFDSGNLWSALLDSVAINDGGSGDLTYAMGGYTFAPQSGWVPGYIGRVRDGGPAGGNWLGSETLGSGTGPYSIDTTRFVTQANYGGDVSSQLVNRGPTPGGANLTLAPVPEPATMTALALGAVALLRRRRQR